MGEMILIFWEAFHLFSSGYMPVCTTLLCFEVVALVLQTSVIKDSLSSLLISLVHSGNGIAFGLFFLLFQYIVSVFGWIRFDMDRLPIYKIIEFSKRKLNCTTKWNPKQKNVCSV